jgi:hypothetical protein
MLHPPEHFVVGFLDPAQIAAETVLIQLLACLFVPKPTGVGADLIAEQNLAFVAAEFELEIDQYHSSFVEKLAKDLVHEKRERLDRSQL